LGGGGTCMGTIWRWVLCSAHLLGLGVQAVAIFSGTVSCCCSGKRSDTRNEGPARISCCQSASPQQALFCALCCICRRMWQEEGGTAGSVSPNARPALPPLHQWHRGAAACLLTVASRVALDHGHHCSQVPHPQLSTSSHWECNESHRLGRLCKLQ
jgi:hypothetical protein